MLSSDFKPSMPDPPSDNRFRVLVIEARDALAAQLMGMMDKTGFEVRVQTQSAQALLELESFTPHLVVIGLDSFEGSEEMCVQLRERTLAPLLALSSGDEMQEVRAFKIGADDCLATPPRPPLFLARLVALLRRAYRYNAPVTPPNPFGLEVEDDEPVGTLPSGWIECEACGHKGPRSQFEKQDILGNVKMICPSCASSDHIIISID